MADLPLVYVGHPVVVGGGFEHENAVFKKRARGCQGFVCMRVGVGATSVCVASFLSNGASLCVGGVSSPQLLLIFLVLVGFCKDCIVTAL